MCVIANVALEGRYERRYLRYNNTYKSRPPQRRVCCLGFSPHTLLLPDSSDADDKDRIAPGSGRRGIAPTMGGADALFAPALILLPLLAMPPFDSVAVVAAATTTTIKTKATAAARRQLRRKRGGGVSAAADPGAARRWQRQRRSRVAVAWRRQWQRGGGGCCAAEGRRRRAGRR